MENNTRISYKGNVIALGHTNTANQLEVENKWYVSVTIQKGQENIMTAFNYLDDLLKVETKGKCKELIGYGWLEGIGSGIAFFNFEQYNIKISTK